MKLADMGGRIALVRERRGLWWVFVGRVVRWATSLREAFEIVEGLAS